MNQGFTQIIKALSVILLVILCITGCVSPFYGTARIEEGFHVKSGIAGITYIGGVGEWNAYHIGGRGDVQLTYGFNRYLQIDGRLGFGGGYNLDPYPASRLYSFFPEAALGVQGALPVKVFAPALRVELSYPMSSIGLLLGFGEKELVTLGGRAHFGEFVELYTGDVFIGIHPLSRWSFFAGANLSTIFEGRIAATLGVGYKIK